MPSVFDSLELEWAQLAHRRPDQDLAPTCEEVDAATLGELLAWARAASPTQSDQVLRPLAEAAVAGSDLAARVLLQILLPGTCRLAARWWVLGDADERAAAAVAVVYSRIRHYPLDRRPTKVAANILLDAGQDLWRAARKLSAEQAWRVDVDPAQLPRPRRHLDPHPSVELAEVLDDAVAAQRIGAGDAELIVATRIAGRRLADVAVERAVPLRTLQWRRAQAEAALVGTGSAA